MRDILQSRYLRSNVAHKQLARTSLIRTPAYNGQYCLSRQKAHIFSLKLTRFIRTPVNTDNGHFSESRVTNSHIIVNPALRTLVICILFIFEFIAISNYVIIVANESVPCSNNDRLDFEQPVFLPVFTYVHECIVLS